MTITPTITEVHQRHISLDLSAEQVATIIAAEVRRAAGIPDGAEIECHIDAQPVSLRMVEHLAKGWAEPEPKLTPAKCAPSTPESRIPTMPWTADEDATALGLIKANPHLKPFAMANLIAPHLPGRTVQGIEYRIRKKFSKAVTPTETPAPTPAPVRLTATPQQATIIAKLSDANASDLARHLSGLKVPDGWSCDDDIELLELYDGGERNMSTLGGIFEREPDFIVQRVNQLTGKVGQGPRRFPAGEVIAALKGVAA